MSLADKKKLCNSLTKFLFFFAFLPTHNSQQT